MNESATPSAPSGSDETRPRPWRALVLALYAIALVAIASAAVKGWRDHQRALASENALAAEIAASQQRIAALRKRIDRLQNDPATLDRVAREELGLVHPDEVVIVLKQRHISQSRPAR